MHSPATTGVSFVLLIAAVGGAFAYVSANPLEIIRETVGEPWFGFNGTALTPDIAEAAGLEGEQGVLVTVIGNPSPARDAGLRGGDQPAEVGGRPIMLGGDLITEIDGNPVTGREDIQRVLDNSQVGDTVVLTVLRDGEQRTIPIVLGERPG